MPRLSREEYVRPPIVAIEPSTGRAAVWRFRIVFGLILAAIAVGMIALYWALTRSPGEGSPGIQQGLHAATVVLSG